MFDLSFEASLLTVFCTLAGVFALYKATDKNKLVLWVCGIWIVFQGVVSSTGFYLADFSIPPRFLLIIGPPFLFILVLFNIRSGKRFLDQMDLKTLMWSHTLRVPLELVFFWLNQDGYFPTEMTFEGRNFGYIAGLTAPFMIWFTMPATTEKRRWALLIWNMLCILIMINSIRLGILSSPHFAAQYGFEIPNTGLGYFPFIWQPSFLVPLFSMAHIVTIRQLWLRKV